MSRKSFFTSIAVFLCLSLALVGCTTGSVHHFNPSPAASVRSQNLEPAKPRLISDLVKSAQKEFEEANAAQEKGEREASIQHYTKMLDLLKEANLDPGVFYKLRSEFERVVSSQGTQPAPAPDAQGATAPAENVQQAFQTANEAQEKGDHEAALREYTHMLELLSKDGLDPASFYSLRSEFQRILTTGEKQARLYDRQRENQWKRNPTPGPMGDIEIEEPLSDRVLTEVDEIMNLYPRNFQGGLDRSYKYLPYVKEQFAQAGLPEDLVWLAMVESQFSPKVVSRAGASGMWQFMKATGTRYDLKIDRYVDERFNWQKATQAATRMLTELYEHFDGNWPLAVSAYNMGEGGIDRAVASCGGERNLWRLVETSPASEMMQTETKKFYPKLLASIIVAKDPERFGFASNPQPAEETVRVPIRGSYALNALERALELPDGTLRQLNPDLIRGVTPPSGEFPLAVPGDASEKIASVMADLPQVRPEILRGWDRKQTYIVRRGDTLDTIAKKCGVSTDDLMKANRLKPDTRLSSGRKITVPGDNFSLDQIERISSTDDEPAAKPEEKPEPETVAEPKREPGSVMKTYTVKPGDTLETIAKRQKVSLKDLLQWNKIKNQAKINAGDQLKLNSIEEIQEKEESTEKTYVVQPGDSPAKIAKLCGVELDDLLQWNKLSKTTPIHEGEKLLVHGIQQQEPQDKGPDAPPDVTTEKAQYKVAKGDTASSIADKYGVKVSEFLSWNKLTPKSVIREGDSYTVYVKSEKPKAAPAAKSKDTKVAKAAPEAKPKAAEKKEEAKPEPKKDTKTAKAAPEAKPKAAEKKEEAKPEPKKDTKTAKADASKKDATPKDAAPKDTPAAKKTTHVVAKGDTASTIASRYKVKLSDLYKWNNWGKNVVLQIGQKVTVQKD